MAQELQGKVFNSRPKNYSNYIDRIDKLGKDFIEYKIKTEERKAKFILDMKDIYLEMKQHGYYDLPNSSICASICKKMKELEGTEISDAYVRMTLPAEFKDMTHVTHDNILKQALRASLDRGETISLEGINIMDILKKEDLDSLSKEEINLFYEKWLDVVKESKRRVKMNRENLKSAIKEICDGIKIDSALADDTKKFPAMNDQIKEILLRLRIIVKNTKKINAFMNMVLDGVNNSPMLKSDYNRMLQEIFLKTEGLKKITDVYVANIEKLNTVESTVT